MSEVNCTTSRFSQTTSKGVFRVEFDHESGSCEEIYDPYAYSQRIVLTPLSHLYVHRLSTKDGLMYAFNPSGNVRWVTFPGDTYNFVLMSEDDYPLFKIELLDINIKWKTGEKQLVIIAQKLQKVTFLRRETGPIGIRFSPLPDNTREPVCPDKLNVKLANHLKNFAVIILSLFSLYRTNLVAYSTWKKSNCTDCISLILSVFIECVCSILFYCLYAVYMPHPLWKEIHIAMKDSVAAFFAGLNVFLIGTVALQPQIDYILLILQQITFIVVIDLFLSNWKR